MNTHEKENAAEKSAAIKKKKRRVTLSTGKKVAITVILALYILVLMATSLFVFYRPNADRSSLTAVLPRRTPTEML